MWCRTFVQRDDVAAGDVALGRRVFKEGKDVVEGLLAAARETIDVHEVNPGLWRGQ